MNSKESKEKSGIFLGLIILVFSITVIFVVSQLRTDPIQQALTRKDTLAGLIVLLKDNVPLFNEIVYIHPETKRAAMLDIPPETGLYLSELKRYDSVDSLFSAGNWSAYYAKMEEISGLPLHFSLVMDLDQLGRVVDLASGIEIFLSNPFEKIDEEPYVLLPSGNNMLDGHKIKDYLSYSEEGESITERIGRHQKLMQSLFRRLVEEKDNLIQSSVLSFFHSQVTTSLDALALATFIETLGQSDLEKMVFLRVMGDVRPVDGKNLLFPHYNGNLLKETIKQVSGSDLPVGSIEASYAHGNNLPGEKTAEDMYNSGETLSGNQSLGKDPIKYGPNNENAKKILDKYLLPASWQSQL